MSRVMLALKIVFADTDKLPVLIFDEVDSGIGGLTAGSIGEALSSTVTIKKGEDQIFLGEVFPRIPKSKRVISTFFFLCGKRKDKNVRKYSR